MNAGIVASRYAKALLKYVQEEGLGERVYSQVRVLVRVMNEVPQMKDYLTDALNVSLEQKISLLSAALDTPLEPSVERFLRLVSSHRRVEFFPRMLLSFIEQYRAENNIMVGRIVTAVHNEGLQERLENVFHNRTGAEVHLQEKVDSDIIGGFVFELEGCRIDASVESQLQRLQRQLVEKNNRIV